MYFEVRSRFFNLLSALSTNFQVAKLREVSWNRLYQFA